MFDELWNFLKQLFRWIAGLFSSSITPASNLQYYRIGEYNNMERYRFSWTPSTSTSAASQDVIVVYGGYSHTALSGSAMNVNQVIYDLPSGVNIGWYVQTWNASRSLSASTELQSFTSYIKPPDPLTPATNLSASWMQTV